LAFAFCAYDGGWLPSEAEWEAVASGTDPSNKNYYPWGPKSDGPDSNRATYNFTCITEPCPIEDILRRVGSAAAGVSAFGQYDMAGSLAEWMMDYYDASFYSSFISTWCNDCVNVVAPALGQRSIRGGNAWSSAAYLRVTARNYSSPGGLNKGAGLRCARPR
jgi:formylglycine-generating enzyme required for sulfatase activity